MHTRSSSNLPVVSPSNQSTSNPKRRNRRRSKQPFILEESPVDTMADQRTMAELLRAPTEGYAEAFVVPPILAEQFELKHSLINMMTSDQFFRLEKDNPHDHFHTFYNALNPADQDSLNAVAGGNLLERHTQDVLTIIENISKVPNSQNKAIVSQVKSCDANSNSSSEIAKLTHAVNHLFQMNSASTLGSGSLPSNTVANLKGELKAITTRSGLVLDVPIVPTPPPFINPEEDERVEETLTDPDLSRYTIKVLPSPVQKYKPLSQRDYVVHKRDPLHSNIPYPSRMLKQKQQEKDEVQIHKFWQMFKQLHINITLADALILIPKFTFPADFVIVDYESDPRVPLILGRPFLRTARALIDVHGEEMILCDGDERLILNIRHDTSSYSNQPQKESINLINVFNNSSKDFLEDLFSTNQPSGNPTFSSHPELTLPEVQYDIFDLEGGNVLPEKLLDLDSTKDLHPPLCVNPLSGTTSYSSSLLLEELADELALITFSLKYDDDLYNLVNPANNFVDSMPEMFTNEHDPDYSSPLIFDEYDDNFLEVESDTENVYDDPFDSKGEKIKESKLFIDELDFPCDFLLPFEYDSFISHDFSRVDAKPLTNNEDKVFNPSILIQEKPFEIITRVVQDKKLATSNASLVLKDFDPLLYEPLFFKEVPRSNMLLLFSSKNKEKVFKPRIHTS
uniref:Reverse transcriptase domain-containing protein n=1 Tax=Tanacetum cinerariifolium TaxID=118510 RepID=A0A6L2JPU2_TANCI|nr:hypothetical protein [Tanacetum cinerariifolium]